MFWRPQELLELLDHCTVWAIRSFHEGWWMAAFRINTQFSSKSMKTQFFFWTAQQELRTIMNFGGRSLFVQKIFRGVLAAFNMLFKVVSFFFFFNSCIYLAALSLSCGRWDLGPWPGIEPRPPVLGVQSLSHWTTREVPLTLF